VCVLTSETRFLGRPRPRCPQQAQGGTARRAGSRERMGTAVAVPVDMRGRTLGLIASFVRRRAGDLRAAGAVATFVLFGIAVENACGGATSTQAQATGAPSCPVGKLISISCRLETYEIQGDPTPCEQGLSEGNGRARRCVLERTRWRRLRVTLPGRARARLRAGLGIESEHPGVLHGRHRGVLR
jgi:hypothetical protein